MKRKPALITLLLAGSFAVAPPLLSRAHLHPNWSDSVPLGLYRETPNGPYAAFCLPLPVLLDAQHRGLELPQGSCPGQVLPILKPLVSASPSAPVTLSVAGFSVHGILLPNTAPKTLSSSGQPLPHYPFGTYTTGLWAISRFNRNSFDSRYFGPVERRAVLYHVTPFLITERKIDATH